MKILNAFGAALLLCALFVAPILAEDKKSLSQVLITNVMVFDGRGDKLTEPTSVLIEGNKSSRLVQPLTLLKWPL